MKKSLLLILISSNLFAATMDCQVKVKFENFKKRFLSRQLRSLELTVENGCNDDETQFEIDENGDLNLNYCRNFHDQVAYQIISGVKQLSQELVQVDLYTGLIGQGNDMPELLDSFTFNPNEPFSRDIKTNIMFKRYSKRRHKEITQIHFQCNQ
jgi:hypothetical protein